MPAFALPSTATSAEATCHLSICTLCYCRWEDDEQRAAIAAAAMTPGSTRKQASPLAAAALSAAAVATSATGAAAGGKFVPCSPPAQRPHARRHASRCSAVILHCGLSAVHVLYTEAVQLIGRGSV